MELDDEIKAAMMGPRAQSVGAAPAGWDDEIVGLAITGVDAAGPFSAELAPGDILLEVGEEPFFRGRGGLATLHQWLMRELTAVPRRYPVRAWRDGAVFTAFVPLALGPYRQ